MKNNRVLSFMVLGLIYVFATVVGVVVYKLLSFDFWLNLLIADVVATVFTFIFSLIFKNASVYDPYWSVQPPIIITLFAIKCGLNILGIFLMVAVWFWGVRLTANWAYTFKNLTCQDWRYTMLSEKTGKLYPIVNFVGIHLVPTLVVYFCILPAVFAIKLGLNFNVFSGVFAFFAVCSATMQGIADIQMHEYRKNRKGNFIRVGLWKYSRHPNYLGEICMWWNIGLSVVIANLGYWYLLLGAVLNTLLFLFVSIPLAEGRQSKKEGYEEYKKETRALLPIKKGR